MSKGKLDVVRGSGNIFRDFGDADADLEQLRAILAARIVGVLDDQGLSVRKAGEITGIAAADFSRIRQAKLDRFTVDRLMTILARLDQQVHVAVTVRPRRRAA
jgi:predicted XRE-type DNA-binding protein